METLIAVHSRRSNGSVKQDAIPKSLIETILSAAAQAPNHYKVRPWRFFVITGQGRNRLGDAMARSLSQKNQDIPKEALERERAKPLRAPLIIAVGVDKPIEPKVLEIENICATASACQNILLAAQALGLAAIWRTGPAALDTMVKDFLGLEHDQHLISFIYIGYPDKTAAPIDRPDFTDRTVWIT